MCLIYIILIIIIIVINNCHFILEVSIKASSWQSATACKTSYQHLFIIVCQQAHMLRLGFMPPLPVADNTICSYLRKKL